MDYILRFGTTISGTSVKTLTYMRKPMIYTPFLNWARHCGIECSWADSGKIRPYDDHWTLIDLTILVLLWNLCNSKLTCCNLLNLWISSMNKIVFLLKLVHSFLATFATSFTSFIPAMVADSLTNLKFWPEAMHVLLITWARDVCNRKQNCETFNIIQIQ